MALINENISKLQNRYLFSEIAERTKAFLKQNPEAPIIKLGIGDTTQPLPPSIIAAFHEGVEEMAKKETYKGYGPYRGYEFLRKAIIENDFKPRGVDLELDEIFVSEGAKSDTANILDIFGKNVVAISDPSYPVYVDTNVMAGNTGNPKNNGQYEGLVYLKCDEKTGFLPPLPETHVDLIYLCSPNNPTGTAMTKDILKQWVDYALENNAIILYDAAYERYISEDNVPHSIFEVEGAKKVAIEFRSFSKTAGFTGVRCSYTIIPKELKGYDSNGKEYSINDLWFRRQSTKYNGVSYPVQRAAAAVFGEQGKKEIDGLISYYMDNARLIREGLDYAGFKYFGGVNAPYIWLKTPGNMSSWDFFDLLLKELNIVGTPGSGFGPSGEGYFRLTAFGDKENTKEAVERIKSYDWNSMTK